MTSPTSSPTDPSACDGEASVAGLFSPCPPMLFNAYFATKSVKEANGSTTVHLNRINTHVLGRVLYIVVERVALSIGTSITIKLKTNDTRLTGTAKQSLLLTNGATDVESFTATIGDTSALKDRSGACAYSNLSAFSDKAIFKIVLRPQARATFDTWAKKIQTAGENLPSIRIEVSSSAGTELSIDWLTLENKKVYEIYHERNAYNFLKEQRRISHIENNYTADVRYYFFNRIDNCHMICELVQSRVRRRSNGRKLRGLTTAPQGYVASGPAPRGGDAEMNFFYNFDPQDTTTRSPRSEYFKIVSVGRNYGVIEYNLANPTNSNDTVDLVRMPEKLNHDQETGENKVRAKFIFQATPRQFCNPGCFAGFLGVLIQLGRTDVVCTGMCFEDATSYPSVSHPNGDSVDTLYLNTLSAEQAKVDAFLAHYFTTVRKGKSVSRRAPSWLRELDRAKPSDDHDTHLHAEDFDTSKVVILNQ